jgi:hypothetical protein
LHVPGLYAFNSLFLRRFAETERKHVGRIDSIVLRMRYATTIYRRALDPTAAS